MSELLSPEEKSALQESFEATRRAARAVSVAVFPSVRQLDPDRTAALNAGLGRWLERLVPELSVLLRVPCFPRSSRQESLARRLLPPRGEEPFWAAVAGASEPGLLLSMPRSFAAAICERLFGAPLQVREERALAPSESALFRELAESWLQIFTQAWNGPPLRACGASALEAPDDDVSAINWLRFTVGLLCGPVEGTIHVAMPPSTVRLLLGEGGRGGTNHLSPGNVCRRLGEVPVELCALLGEAEFSLDELASLRVGDVIALARRAQDPIDILVERRVFFRARPGLSGQTVAFELIGAGSEEAEYEC